MKQTTKQSFGFRLSQYKGVIVKKSIITNRPQQHKSHWYPLHSYPPEHASDWNPHKAELFFADWESKIPNCCSQNWKNYRANLPTPPFHSPHKFFSWGVDAHNYVSTHHANPNHPEITLDQAYSIYWPQRYTAHSYPHPFVTALSLLPKHKEVQSKCLNSWVNFGAYIIAVNTREEINQLIDLYPQVDKWVECNKVSTNYAYPTQLIINLLKQGVRETGRCIIINSDIEVRGTQAQLPPESSWSGIRWDYTNCYSTASEFQWGLDVFNVSKEEVYSLPEDFPFAIGQTIWDYALPGLLKLPTLHGRCFYHKYHEVHWNKESLTFGRKWMVKHGMLKDIQEKTCADFRYTLEDGHIYDVLHKCYIRI